MSNNVTRANGHRLQTGRFRLDITDIFMKVLSNRKKFATEAVESAHKHFPWLYYRKSWLTRSTVDNLSKGLD